jgi:hypothetical protein
MRAREGAGNRKNGRDSSSPFRPYNDVEVKPLEPFPESTVNLDVITESFLQYNW